MGRSEDRVAARQAVHEAQLVRRRERAERDRRLQALAVEVQVTLKEGQARLRTAEAAAGEWIATMITDYGASVGEVVDWCCGAVSQRDVTRLRGLTQQPGTIVNRVADRDFEPPR